MSTLTFIRHFALAIAMCFCELAGSLSQASQILDRFVVVFVLIVTGRCICFEPSQCRFASSVNTLARYGLARGRFAGLVGAAFYLGKERARREGEPEEPPAIS